jgi:hypothetical protein
VYGIATILIFPGILRDPLIYDLGLGLVPVSFYVMAILGGGIATTLKKSAGLDLRGRTFEMVIVLATFCLVMVSWGLVGAFFGKPSSCYGLLGGYDLENRNFTFNVLQKLETFVLSPAQNWFLMWDRLASNSSPWLRRVFCMPNQETGCFEHSYKANAEFLFDDKNEGRCASDLLVVFSLLQATVVVAAGNHFWKRRERQRRAARRPRPHQD